jgi:hypothetical protein
MLIKLPRAVLALRFMTLSAVQSPRLQAPT